MKSLVTVLRTTQPWKIYIPFSLLRHRTLDSGDTVNVLSIYYCTALQQGEVLRTGLVLCKRSDLSGVSSGLFIWNLVSITNLLTTDE